MKRAILLMNMGGPNNLNEVEVFLTNMFNDKNIIGAPKPIRAMIAKFITFSRTEFAQNNYALIGGKSPIIGYTQELIKKLEENIKDASIHMVMRYTPPFAEDVLENLRDVDEFYAIPLYPHYSSTTTLSSYEDLYESFDKLKIKARVQTIYDYYNDKYYNNSIVERIKEALSGEDPEEYELIFSAHGLPKKVIEKGDVYQKQIRYNVYHARKALMNAGVDFYNTHLAYQSRLGPLEWITPYLDDKLKSLKKKKVILFPIAFTVDNSETEFELEIEYREIAEELGLEEYRVAKAPNDHPEFVKCLTNIYEDMKAS
ncbi:ferrochelatase [Sulfurimonas aquatica]|uniref:Ferrochelatase n=1 Tax=Sulfurimonas aquatica TaxID=2672570 RepID=A0A975B0T6_9BACT|nr:ferrochelatase [Sulfurimonas aquatica]QSZ42137.1 ferrochelatase [Sulfurimonas aquatica]